MPERRNKSYRKKWRITGVIFHLY